MATDRKDVRDWLGTLLSGKLVGAGKPAKTVTTSKSESLQGITPLVAVLSSGSEPQRMTFRGNRGQWYFDVQVWVRQGVDGTWTNRDAEDTLDGIERLISEAYRDASDYTVEYSSRTTVIEVVVDGEAYYLERVPTVVSTPKE